MSERARLGLRRLAVVGFLSVSLFFSIRQAREWSTQELSPFHRWLEALEETIPRDQGVLIVAPPSARGNSQVLQINARLYPRHVHLLPSEESRLEDAEPWIREKRLGWAIHLGGAFYDPAGAWVRRIDGSP